MTCIAYHNGIMAADKQSTSQGLCLMTTKIRKLDDGRLVGCSGNSGMARELIAWLLAGSPSDTFPGRAGLTHMMVVMPGGQILMYDDSPQPIPLENPFMAIGSGRDYAMAAMHLGFDPVTAVGVACVFDDGCGQGIDVIRMD